jgi:hypothetical protein
MIVGNNLEKNMKLNQVLETNTIEKNWLYKAIKRK